MTPSDLNGRGMEGIPTESAVVGRSSDLVEPRQLQQLIAECADLSAGEARDLSGDRGNEGVDDRGPLLRVDTVLELLVQFEDLGACCVIEVLVEDELFDCSTLIVLCSPC